MKRLASWCRAFKGASLTRKFNGLFSFNQDGFPVLGEAPNLPGFWSAQAVWITHAGGVGKAVAEWIDEGEPTTDLRECDISRFHPHAHSRSYIRARAAQQYREVYDIIHPLQQIASPRDLRVTPFHSRHKDLGAVFFEDSGWERPRWFAANDDLDGFDTIAGISRDGWEAREWSPSIAKEHAATRERVAMFDLTPFAKFEVTGSGALAALQKIAANQLDRPVGSIIYTPMLTKRGGIKCDLTITRLEESRFLIVTGGSMGIHDLRWIRSHLPDDGSVSINDVSASPLLHRSMGTESARSFATVVTDHDVSNASLPYLKSISITISDIPAMAFRISYVGELGWEIYVSVEHGLRLWDVLWDAGQSLGVVAAGSGAFDSLRLEKGYRLWGNDIHTEYNPYEAGIGFAVSNRKGDFIGKTALGDARGKATDIKLCCLTLDDPERVVMGKEPILDGNRTLGYVTSANYGHTVGRGIAYGYLPVSHAKVGNGVEIEYFGERIAATVAQEPLYDPKGRKLRT